MNDEVNEILSTFVRETGRPVEEWRPGWEPSWNIAPTQNIPMLFESARGGDEVKRRFEPAYWSLVPSTVDP